jgi:nitroreductase
MSASTFDAVSKVIRQRRTSMKVESDREVPAELIERLCELASWAPCHKRTWPWRFASVTGDARWELGDVAAEAMAARGDEPARVTKTRTKFARTPAVLVVGSAPGDTPLRTTENRDATAAAVQNLLLAATAAGLASYWSSCPKGASTPVAQWCGFDEGTEVVALVYLGWADGEVAVPERPVVTVRHLG